MTLRHHVLWPQQEPRRSCSHGWVMAHALVTYEWVTSRMNESCHTWMSHATHEWVMPHMNESCHTWMSLVTHGTYASVTHEWVMSRMISWAQQEHAVVPESRRMWIGHAWMSHVTLPWAQQQRTARIFSLLQRSFAKETYHFKEHTHRSHTTYRDTATEYYGVATISRLLKMIGLFCKI